MNTIVKLIIPEAPTFEHAKGWIDSSPDWRSMQVALELAETKLSAMEFEMLEGYAKARIAKLNADAVGQRIGRWI